MKISKIIAREILDSRGASSFAEALRIGAEIFHTLKGILKKRGL